MEPKAPVLEQDYQVAAYTGRDWGLAWSVFGHEAKMLVATKLCMALKANDNAQAYPGNSPRDCRGEVGVRANLLPRAALHQLLAVGKQQQPRMESTLKLSRVRIPTPTRAWVTAKGSEKRPPPTEKRIGIFSAVPSCCFFYN